MNALAAQFGSSWTVELERRVQLLVSAEKKDAASRRGSLPGVVAHPR